MSKSNKFYIFLTIFLGFSIAAVRSADQISNYYENTVATNVCEGDSNIIKAGWSVAVGQIVRVTPGILTGVTLDKMGDCYRKYGATSNGSASSSNGIIDLNDPCNQIAFLNPNMKKENYAYIPLNDEETFKQSRGGFTAFTNQLETINKKATSGKMIFNHEYFAARTLKDVPFLQKSYAAESAQGYNQITSFTPIL